MRFLRKPIWLLLGLIGVVALGAIVIVANSGPAGNDPVASGPLVSVSVSDQSLTLDCRGVFRKAVRDLTDTDWTAEDGAYEVRFVIGEIPELEGQPADTDIDATAVLDELAAGSPGSRRIASSNPDWTVAHKTENRMVLTNTGGGMIFARRTDAGWQARSKDSDAPCRVQSEGSMLRWAPSRNVEADAAQLEVVVEASCGDPVVEVFSAVTIGEDAVIMTISGHYQDDGEWGCTTGSVRKVVVDIGEPIGERDLFNGNEFPPSRVPDGLVGLPVGL